MNNLETQTAEKLRKAISNIEGMADSHINMRGILTILNTEVLNVRDSGLYNLPMYNAVQKFKQNQEREMTKGAELNARGAIQVLNRILGASYN